MGLFEALYTFVDKTKMSMRSFGGDKIIFDRITAFLTSSFRFALKNIEFV